MIEENKNNAKQAVEVPPASLEGAVEFSWRSVYHGWVQNLKDDVDPAIKGAKMGLFGLHAIPTWMRQYDEGKMSTRKPFLSGLLGLIVAGSSVSAYAAAGKYINDSTQSDWGYAMIGVPVTSQAVSWAYEAFLKAKKTEMSKIVMTRLERSLNAETAGEYDVSNKVFIDALAANLYKIKETDTNERIEHLKDEIESVKNTKDLDERRKKFSIDKFEADIKNLEKSLEKYKTTSVKHARKGMFYAAKNVFDGLVADNQLGKKYKMSVELETGPVKRQKDRDMQNWNIDCVDEDEDEQEYYRFVQQNGMNLICDIVKASVKEKNGSAKIELLGTITSVYTNDGKDMSYEVTPNEKIWKV